MSLAVILHATAGILGILSGALALTVAKGGRLHRLSGTVFFVAMLIVSAMGVTLAVGLHQPGNVMAGAFTFYLVITAWLSVRRRSRENGFAEIAAMLLGCAVAAMGVSFGIRATLGAGGNGTAPDMLYVFAGLAAFAALLDLRVILRRGLEGRPRMARHIWRMCSGLFIATGSFFLGQQKVMPTYMQGSPILFVLALAPLAAMVFWLIRIRLSHRFSTAIATA